MTESIKIISYSYLINRIKNNILTKKWTIVPFSGSLKPSKNFSFSKIFFREVIAICWDIARIKILKKPLRDN